MRPILSCHHIIFHIQPTEHSGTDCDDAGKTSTAILDLSDVRFRGRDQTEKVIFAGRTTKARVRLARWITNLVI